MLIVWIKKLFGIYESGYEYWIPTDQIVISPEFARTRIGERKWRRKKRYFYRTGQFESKIILSRDFVLTDGYSSYKLAKYVGLDKVPVYFVQIGGFYIEEVRRKSVPIYEQEAHISYMRDEQIVKVYTSDTTQMTKFDRRCKDFPDMWQCVSDDGYGKCYICRDKSLISARGKKVKREMTDEQREAAKRRMVEWRANKKNKGDFASAYD